jgi:hypothetical protein
MAGQPATSTGEPAEKERQESVWASFGRADAKLFMVIFAGTVAANVVTVMIVAVALIAARSGSNGRPHLGAVLIYLGCVIAGVVTVGVGVQALRQKRPKDTESRVIALMVAAFTLLMGLLSSVYLLVLLGYAVGVK